MRPDIRACLMRGIMWAMDAEELREAAREGLKMILEDPTHPVNRMPEHFRESWASAYIRIVEEEIETICP